MHANVKFYSIQNKEKVLKASRKKNMKESGIKMTSVFYIPVLGARSHLRDLRENDYHLRILYPDKLSTNIMKEKKDIFILVRTYSKSSSYTPFNRKLLEDVS